eukprot:2547050-Rhodomonas_salina.1
MRERGRLTQKVRVQVSQRVTLLGQGLQDRSDVVRKACRWPLLSLSLLSLVVSVSAVSYTHLTLPTICSV